MKLTYASSYALHALAEMSGQEKGSPPAASHNTAQARGIPDRFLLKILGALARAGVLHSKKGPGGGYHLARSPDKITLLEVIEAVDGRLRGHSGGFGGKGTAALDAKLSDICEKATDHQRRALSRVSLADLVGGSRKK